MQADTLLVLIGRARCEAFAIAACEGAGRGSIANVLEPGLMAMIITYTGYVPWRPIEPVD
jgi:hypothetical protein